jgi:hypothetical protein
VPPAAKKTALPVVENRLPVAVGIGFTSTTQFDPPKGLGTKRAAVGSSCHCPSTTKRYS